MLLVHRLVWPLLMALVVMATVVMATTDLPTVSSMSTFMTTTVSAVTGSTTLKPIDTQTIDMSSTESTDSFTPVVTTDSQITISHGTEDSTTHNPTESVSQSNVTSTESTDSFTPVVTTISYSTVELSSSTRTDESTHFTDTATSTDTSATPTTPGNDSPASLPVSTPSWHSTAGPDLSTSTNVSMETDSTGSTGIHSSVTTIVSTPTPPGTTRPTTPTPSPSAAEISHSSVEATSLATHTPVSPLTTATGVTIETTAPGNATIQTTASGNATIETTAVTAAKPTVSTPDTAAPGTNTTPLAAVTSTSSAMSTLRTVTTAAATHSSITTPVGTPVSTRPTSAGATVLSPTAPVLVNGTTARSNETSAPLTTVSPGSNASSTVSSVTNPTNATTAATCPSIPCPPLSACVNSSCQCLAGTFPSAGRCLEAKVFPGVLHVNRTFKEKMRDPHSQDFQQFAAELVQQLNQALQNLSGYINSTVLELMPGSVVATTENIFDPGSTATRQSTVAAINTAITTSSRDSILASATFNATSLCVQSPAPCDAETTKCSDSGVGVATCSCMPGFVFTEFSPRNCIACPSGSRASDSSSSCVPCSFGYSGFNCNDSSLLALVVVACVLGALLLILLLAILIYCLIHRTNLKHQSYSDCLYPPHEYQSWPSNSLRPFPRAAVASAPPPPAAVGPRVEVVNLDTRPVGGWRSHTNGLKIKGKTGSYDITPMEKLNTFKPEHPSRYKYLAEDHENPYFIPAEEQRAT